MRFAVAHKAATYLVVACAYLAMIAGGQIPGVIAIAGIVGLALSWFWEPPLIKFERWSWVWTTASVFALVYSVLTAVVTGDFLGVGAQFLVWLTVAKAFNRRAARDWQQIYLLSFLMLVAGSVLNADLTYGICFLGFVISVTWALTLFHLRREMEDNLLVKHAADRASERVEVRRILDSKRIVGGRFFLGTGMLSLVVFLASAAAFLALPRVGFGFFLKGRGGLTLTGFSERVKLGGHGLLKSDDTIVMRVEVDSKIGGRDAPALHWRGIAFDEYSKGEWHVTNVAPPTEDSISYPRTGVERHMLSWRNAELNSSTAIVEGAIRQDIWLDPIDSDVMFGASNPRLFDVPEQRRPQKAMRNDELRLQHPNTIHYTVYSQVAMPAVSVLRAAPNTLPPARRDYGVYLQVPPEITKRTRELAAQITVGQTNNYDKAQAIVMWLDANTSYSLELKEPGSQEPLDFFLFDRKEGHCEYYASAFAILARLNGIPTRQVNGFFGGEWNEYQGYVAVRAGDAHSWDEVYFPGKGWVTFDPTPPDRTDPLGRGGSGWRARMARFMDTVRFQWTKWVIEYDLVAQLSLFKDIGSAIKRGAIALRDAVVHIWPILVVVVGAIVLVVIVRRRRAPNDPLEAARRTRARARSAIARSYDRVVRLLAKHGITREPGVTPRELAARLTTPVGAPVRELTDLYYAAEWGGRITPDAERRADELAAAIRTTLLSTPGATR
jgi:protein-glutamine gamma-glutamyltransferase